jgi:hypothetical protein
MPSVPRFSTCAVFVAIASLPGVGWAVTNSSLSSVHEVPAPSSGTSSAPAREGGTLQPLAARESKPGRTRLLVLNDCPGVSSSIL